MGLGGVKTWGMYVCVHVYMRERKTHRVTCWSLTYQFTNKAVPEQTLPHSVQSLLVFPLLPLPHPHPTVPGTRAP